MDWLEDFFPFLRSLDAGDGAIEISLVLLVALGAVAAVVVLRRRAGAGATEGPTSREPTENQGS